MELRTSIEHIPLTKITWMYYKPEECGAIVKCDVFSGSIELLMLKCVTADAKGMRKGC